jgi:alcohol dehydrogenase class IV
MLPVALRINRTACEADMADLARLLWTNRSFSSNAAAADTLIGRITQLCDELHVPKRLSDLGVEREQVPGLVQGSRGNSMSGNPCQLSDIELQQLLEEML